MNHELTIEERRKGGIETLIKYGPQRCPCCGRLPEKSDFHVENGKRGGLKGIRTLQLRYSKEQRRAWARMGGRGRTKEKRLNGGNECR